MYKSELKYMIRYNGEVIARTKYYFEANLLYDNLVKRGKEHETVYPFVCQLVNVIANLAEKTYTSPKPLTREQLDAMKKEYGI